LSWGYEITGFDVHSAFHYAIKAAQKLGLEEQIRRDIKKMLCMLSAEKGTYRVPEA
jgi:hypothetical protein